MDMSDGLDNLLREIEKLSLAMKKKNYNYMKVKGELVPTGLCFAPTRAKRRPPA